jgi:hypothetical protein
MYLSYPGETSLQLKITVNMESHGVITSTSPTTFHNFPKIPAELQLKIWKYAASQPEPAIIKLKAYKHAENGKKKVRFSSSNIPHGVGIPLSDAF